MKGITPVIAIILLLLMAVAAAGGFYFVYQGFTESGEESGSTQIEQLGETSLAALQIESAAGGRLYVKNVGAGDVNLSKVSVYVENVPYNVNASSDTLAERSRAVLKFTQRPSCSSDRCEVKISGAASTSRTLDSSKLSCASDADCYSGESCEGGVCSEGGEEGPVCGDGVCSGGETSSSCPADCYCGNGECEGDEDGLSCFSDCGPRSLLLPVDENFIVDYDCDLHPYHWDGSSYAKGENMTQDDLFYIYVDNDFDSSGDGLAVGLVGEYDNYDGLEIFASRNSSGAWSSPENVTENNGWQDFYAFSDFDFNSTGGAMLLWTSGDNEENVGWASHDGGWSAPQNLTENIGGLTVQSFPDFAFAPWDDGMAVWASASSANDWLNYSFWDNGWGEEKTLLSLEDSLSHGIYSVDVEFNGTHGLAVWSFRYSYMPSPYNYVIQWSTWDNATWSPVQNVSDELGSVGTVELEHDGSDWLLLLTNESASPPWPEWYSWSSDWNYEGNLTSSDPNGIVLETVSNENGALMALLINSTTAGMTPPFAQHFTYWTGTEWTEPVLIPGNACFAGL